MSSTLSLYSDPLSQPCRAVWLFCLENHIPLNIIEIRIAKGDTRTNQELKAKNPNQKVPVLDDNGFTLAESHAIMRYLATTRKTPDHWYPADPKARAKVDQYLESHHHGLRTAADYLRAVLLPQFMGYSPEEAKFMMKISEKSLKRTFKLLDDTLSKQPYLCGDKISIADLSAACEFAQLALLPSIDVSPYQNIAAWYKRVQSLQHWKNVHAALDKLVAKSVNRPSKL